MEQQINVIDDRIPHIVLKAAIAKAESCQNYGVLHPGGDGSYGFKYNWMFMQRDQPDTFTDPVIKSLWDEVRKHVPSNTILRRGYINAHSFGVEDNIHYDDPEFENGLTVIVYLCNSWYAAWGGQTMFFKNFHPSENEIEKSVLPRYNRMVIFDKNLPHCVAPLSHRFAGVRLTCMFKLELVNDPA